MSSGRAAGSWHGRLEDDIAPSQLLHGVTTQTWGCHKVGVMEQASSAQTGAARLDRYLTLSCSSYKIRGRAPGWKPWGGPACTPHLHMGSLALWALVLGFCTSTGASRAGGRWVRSDRLLDQAWLGKGRSCKLWQLLEMFQTGNLCTSNAYNNLNRFHCLHGHIRQPWQKGGWIGRWLAVGENSGLRKASSEHVQRVG